MLPQPSLDNCSRALSTGKHVAYRVHAENFRVYICKRGLDSHKALGNRLVNMLADSGYLREALATFDKLAFPENLLWNTLISKYINCQDPLDALALYHRLQKHASFHLSERNCVAFLKASAKNRDLEWGLEIHGEIARLCINIDVFMGSTLVHLYISCGSLSKAHQVLVALPVRNVVSWNALMAGYAKFGYGEQVLGCFDQMLHERITPDSVSFLCALKACGICGTLERGRELHAEIERKSILVEDAAVGNTLVDMYVKCGSMARAQDVFDRLPTRNVVTWTNLIAGLAEHGDGKTASMCFEHMQAEGISPDAIAVACGLKACGLKEMEDDIDEDVDDGIEVQVSNSTSFDLSEETDITSMSFDKAKQTSKSILHCSPTSQTAEVSEYLRRRKGVLHEPEFMHAQETFSTSTTYCGIDKSVLCSIDISSRPKNLIVGNTLLDMYAKRGLIRKAQNVFDSLAIQDQVSWNILISGYAEHGHGREALKRYEQMRQCGFHSGIISYVSVLKACGTIGALEDGLKIHSDITKKGFLESDLVIGSSLVDMYAKCCTLEMARQVFDTLPVQNVVSWTSLMDGYTRHGYGDEAIKLFDKMQPKGIFPDVATVVSLLKACINIGDTHKGQEIHAEIERRGFLERDLAIGNTLVDMYAKCGSLSKAHGLFNSLPLHDVISWNSLIAGYAGLGRFEKALEWLEQMQIEGVSPDAVTYAWSLKACNKTGTLLESEIIFTGIKRTQSPKGYVSAGFVRQGPLTTAQEGLYMS